jgi:photosystem II stability/assembly factor-like uncharacterized protein
VSAPGSGPFLAAVALPILSAVWLQPERGLTPLVWEPQTSGVAVRLRGISAVSSTAAWASGAGGTVLRTTDGGTSWQRRPVPDADGLDFRDVEAMSATTAVVLSIGNGGASRIHQTLDGGATWHERFRSADPKAFFDAIAFADARHGVAVSDAVDGRFVILQTADGGQTWTPVPADRLPAARGGEGAFAASGTNVTLAGRDHIWLGTTAGRVLRSTDGGRTWTVHATPVATGEATGIFSIAFRDRTHGAIVGGNYRDERAAMDNVAVTADGGATWTRPSGTGLSGFRSAVAWVPRREHALLAVGPTGADWSDDDGRTWRPAGGAGYDAISIAPSGDVGWASGANGRVARVTFR